MNPILDLLKRFGMEPTRENIQRIARMIPGYERFAEAAIGASNTAADVARAGSRAVADFGGRAIGEMADPVRGYGNYLRGMGSGALGLARFLPGESRAEQALMRLAGNIAPEEGSAQGSLGRLVGDVLPDLVNADAVVAPGRMAEVEGIVPKTLEASAFLPLIPGGLIRKTRTLRHYSPALNDPTLEALEPSRMGTGPAAGWERGRNPSGSDRAYEGVHLYDSEGRNFDRPEQNLGNYPHRDFQVDDSRLARPEDLQKYLEQARKDTGYMAGPQVVRRMEELAHQDGWAGFYSPDHGVVKMYDPMPMSQAMTPDEVAYYGDPENTSSLFGDVVPPPDLNAPTIGPSGRGSPDPVSRPLPRLIQELKNQGSLQRESLENFFDESGDAPFLVGEDLGLDSVTDAEVREARQWLEDVGAESRSRMDPEVPLFRGGGLSPTGLTEFTTDPAVARFFAERRGVSPDEYLVRNEDVLLDVQAVADKLGVRTPYAESGVLVRNSAVTGPPPDLNAPQMGAPFVRPTSAYGDRTYGLFDPDAPTLQATREADPLYAERNSTGKTNEFYEAVARSDRLRRTFDADVIRGLKLLEGRPWYELGGLQQLADPDDFRRWNIIGAAASAQNSVPSEFALGSLINFAGKRGVWDFEEAMDLYRRTLGMGPDDPIQFLRSQDHFDRARQGLERGLLLPSSKGNIHYNSASWKTPSYMQARMGASDMLATIDTHERRRMWQQVMANENLRRLAREHLTTAQWQEGLKEGLIPIRNRLDYETLSGIYERGANRFGFPTAAAYQAPRWTGGGVRTGLESNPTRTYQELLADQVRHTAGQRGMDTSPTGLRRLLGSVLRGDDLLLPF